MTTTSSIFHEQNGLLTNGRIPIDCFFERKLEPNIDELRAKYKMPLAKKAFVLGREVELPDLNSMQSVFEYVLISMRSNGKRSSFISISGKEYCRYRSAICKSREEAIEEANKKEKNCACAVGHMIEDAFYSSSIEDVSVNQILNMNDSITVVRSARYVKSKGEIEDVPGLRYCNVVSLALRMYDLPDELLDSDFPRTEGASRIIKLLESMQSIHDSSERYPHPTGKLDAIKVAVSNGLSWLHIPFLS